MADSPEPARSLFAFGREAATYAIASMATGLLTFLLSPFYARGLSEDEFAALTVISSAGALLTAMASLSMENAAHRWFWDTDDETERSRVFSTWAVLHLATATGLSLLLAVLAGPISRAFDVGFAAQAFRISAAILPLRAVFLLSTNWYRARRRPSSVLVLSLVNAVLTIPVTIAVLNLSNPLQWILVGQVGAFVVTTVWALRGVRSWFHISRYSRSLARDMFRFSVPLLPASLASWAVALADRWILAFFVGTNEIARYQVAVTFSLVVGLPVVAFQQAWGPFGLSIHGRPGAAVSFRRVAALLVSSLVAFTTVVCLAAPEALELLFGPRYRDAAVPAAVLSIAQIATAAYAYSSLSFAIARRTAAIGAVIVVGGIVNVATCVVLIPHWGATGAAVAMLATQVVMAALIMTRSERVYALGYRPVIDAVLVTMTATVILLGMGEPLATRALLVPIGLALAAVAFFRAGLHDDLYRVVGVARTRVGLPRRIRSAVEATPLPWGRLAVFGLSLYAASLPWEIIRAFIPIARSEAVGGRAVSAIDGSRLILAGFVPLVPVAAIMAVRRGHKRAVVLGAGLIALWCVAATWSDAPHNAVVETVRLAGNCALMLLVVGLVATVDGVRTILRWFRRSVVAAAALTMGQAVGFPMLWNDILKASHRFNGPFADPNIAARYFMVGLLVTLLSTPGVVDRYGRAPSGAGRLVSAAVLVGGILATGSRSALVSGAVALAVALVVGGWRVRRRAVAALVVACAGLVAASALVSSIGDRLATVTRGTGALGSRTSLIRAGFAMFRDHPLRGVGLESYGPELLTNYSQYQGYYGAAQTRSHTAMVTTLAEFGVLGVVAVVAVVAVVYLWLRDIEARVAPGGGRVEAVGIVLALVAIVMSAQSEGRMWEEGLLWLLLGCLGALATKRAPARRQELEPVVSPVAVSAARVLEPA